MKNKYYCEYCAKQYHSAAAAMMCQRTPLCRGMSSPPKDVVAAWKGRGCAIILADTAADMVLGSPAARHQPKVRELGLRIKKWTDRLYEALKANTPMSKGVINRIHRGLSDAIFKKVWKKGAPLPNLVALDIAARYAEAARIYVEDRVADGNIHSLWFQQEHPEWLVNGAVAMPLALYISGMKQRRMTSPLMDQYIVGWTKNELDDDRTPIMQEMLNHCWTDELRSWRFLEAALNAMMKWIVTYGTKDSVNVEAFNVEEGFEALLEYIWDEEKKPKKQEMKAWLVDGHFWVAAPTRSAAKEVLVAERGVRGKKVQGFMHAAKFWNSEINSRESIAEMLTRYDRPQVIGTIE